MIINTQFYTKYRPRVSKKKKTPVLPNQAATAANTHVVYTAVMRNGSCTV